MVELDGTRCQLTLAEEQLQKTLREKAVIAMEVGKTNDRNLKSQEALVSMEREIKDVKLLFEESKKHARETKTKLEEV